MIGWVILVAVLLPALALGRWAEGERRGSGASAMSDAEPRTTPARSGRHGLGRRRRTTVGAARSSSRSAARRSRTYAGR